MHSRVGLSLHRHRQPEPAAGTIADLGDDTAAAKIPSGRPANFMRQSRRSHYRHISARRAPAGYGRPAVTASRTIGRPTSALRLARGATLITARFAVDVREVSPMSTNASPAGIWLMAHPCAHHYVLRAASGCRWLCAIISSTLAIAVRRTEHLRRTWLYLARYRRDNTSAEALTEGGLVVRQRTSSRQRR